MQQSLERSEPDQQINDFADDFGSGERGVVAEQGNRRSLQSAPFERHVRLEELGDDALGYTHDAAHTRRHARSQRPRRGRRSARMAPTAAAEGRGRMIDPGGVAADHATR